MLVKPPGQERRRPLLERYGGNLTRIMDRHEADLAFSRGLRLRRADALMRGVVESSFDGIVTFRPDGTIETANRSALQAFGYEADQIVTKTLFDLFPMIGSSHHDEIDETLQLGQGPRETEGLRKDETRFPVEVAVNETNIDGAPIYVAIVRDITERKSQQEQLRHQALHDSLTGLPNRVLMGDRLTHALEIARRWQEPMALLMLDLDRFKEVNDTLGHQVGDDVLIKVADRLIGAIRASDTVARLGGDEFAVLLPAVTDLASARMVAERIVDSLRAPFDLLEGISLDIGISIGIALFPDHAEEPGKLTQCADIAMYTAKQGQLGISLYDEGKDNHSVRHLTLTGALRRAIEQDELVFHYQPKIDIRTLEVVSVEALARWDHPDYGPVPPDEFVLHAERTGLIEPLTRWAFGTALNKLVDWKETGLELSIAVNLSARNLHEENLPGLVAQLLQEYGVSAEKLILEITESAFMMDPDGASRVVQALADMGVRLSIDDFGSGYSSLAYLRHLPVRELKIDQSFVQGMHKNDEDLVIVRSTIDLAHNLGLEVVAEGIEFARHIEMLQELGCDLGQGFHIGRPMLAEKLPNWLAKGEWRKAVARPAAE
jgi:diguanylate cyclase (GGDEF)-like protein/PAS domain S-box-containing protein